MTASFDNGPEARRPPHSHEHGARCPTARAEPRRPRVPLVARAQRLALFVCALCVLLGFAHADFAPLHIVVDGDDISDGITINGLTDGGRALLGVGALMFTLLLLLLIPVLIFMIVGSVADRPRVAASARR
jgi:hypothetical protein